MNRFIFCLLTVLHLKACWYLVASTTATSVSSSSKMGKVMSDYPPMCDSPPAVKIDPEKCCDFPKIFNESVIAACENETRVVNGSSAADLISDSCAIECMMNKSMNSKLQREGMLNLVFGDTKNDYAGAWNKSLITNAIDACFTELTDDDMHEIVEQMKKEIGHDTKSIVTAICHPKSSLILDCFYRELYKVCPMEKFLDVSPECGALKTYTIACDDW